MNKNELQGIIESNITSKTGVNSITPTILGETLSGMTELTGSVYVEGGANIGVSGTGVENDPFIVEYIGVTPESPTGAVEFTGQVIPLDNTMGSYQIAVANAQSTYTFTGSTLGAFARIRVLRGFDGPPTVTNATKIIGNAFILDVNMYLVIWWNGTRAEYWFERIED